MSQALSVIKVFYDVGVVRTSLCVWKSRMIDAISAVIRGGLEFEPDDFITIMSWRNRAWVNENSFESFYALATGMHHRDDVRNQSAVIALEKYLKRPVYNFDGGRLYAGRSLYLTHNLPSTHKLGWRNLNWTVSSFVDGDDPYVNMLCSSFSSEMKGKRCRLTPADVRAMEKARTAKPPKEVEECAP